MIGGAALIIAAAFNYPAREYVLVGLLLFLPFLDTKWDSPAFPHRRNNLAIWAGLVLVGAAIVVWQPGYLGVALSALFVAALPEEWFFRAYFMASLGRGWRANILASLFFSLLHGLTGDWLVAVLVFAPSLFYGWLYQRTRDLPLLVLAHALSNLVFVLFLAKPLSMWFGYLLGYQG